MVQAGARADDARYLMRQGATLHRLAEGQCNGDWPWDNGERKTVICDACGSGVHPSAAKRIPGTVIVACPDCRTQARVRKYVEDRMFGWDVSFQGDPRGAVCIVYPPTSPACQHALTDRESGRCRCGIGVP